MGSQIVWTQSLPLSLPTSGTWTLVSSFVKWGVVTVAASLVCSED